MTIELPEVTATASPAIELPGVTPTANALYAEMLRRPAAGPGTLAEVLDRPGEEIAGALDELAGLALLRPSWEHPGGLRPVPPDLALDVLIAQQEVELLRRRQEIEANRAILNVLLAEQAAERGVTRGRGAVEELHGLDAVREELDRLTYQVEKEALVLAPDGAQTAEAIEASRPMNKRLLDRGVRMRTIYLNSARNDPATTAHAQWLTEHGSEIRTLPVLPMRVLIADRRRAIVPLDPENSAAGACTLRGGVVAIAVALFEQLWTGARPWGTSREERSVEPTDQERALLQMMASGDTDEQAARKLGVSTRTVGRMVADLMCRLHARSRFQAGVVAGAQGWI